MAANGRPRIPEAEGSWKGKTWKGGPTRGHHTNALRYHPPSGLVEALNLAIDLSVPLLITGRPGTGKTTAAYWAALQLEVGAADVFHETVRSETSARDVKYEFDSVRYFRDAQVQAAQTAAAATKGGAAPETLLLSKGDYIERNVLWRAFAASQEKRVVLLFDEIDKAPRDFPNDLLHELDRLEFAVPARDHGTELVVSAKAENMLLWVCTSNGERELPDAFLRRCLHYRLELDKDQIKAAVESQLSSLANLDRALVTAALERFREVAQTVSQHKPSLAEALVWIQALHLNGKGPRDLDVALGELPFLGALVKHEDDMKVLKSLPARPREALPKPAPTPAS